MTVTRTHRETALVLMAILGGAAWLYLPLAMYFDGERRSAGIALIAGAALGAACASTLTRLSVVTAAVGGALAASVLLGAESLDLHGHAALGREVLLMASLTALAAAAATVLTSVRPLAALRVTGAALVSLAGTLIALMGAIVLGERVDIAAVDVLAVLVGMLSPLLGGVAAALLVPGAHMGHVARGWPMLCIGITLGIFIATATPLWVGPGVFSLIIVCPMLSGLGALGAWMARPRQPLGGESLPPARTVR